MVVRFKQLTRQFNSLKTKKRYREKRERRGFLTEAYLDGELALYKPAHIPYRIFTDKVKPTNKTTHEDYPDLEIEFSESGDTATISSIHKEQVEKPVKLSWFDKLLLFIRRIFKR